MGSTLEERMLDQLSPLAPLLARLIEGANGETTPNLVAQAFPGLRRPAHLRRVGGVARWAEVADGLVETAGAGELPDGYLLMTTEADHNRGRYAFSYPGGVFTLRNAPHDDEKHEGAYLQEQFEEIVEMLDQQGAPGAHETVRVWIRVRPTAHTTFTARDRHGHETTVTLQDLLNHGATPLVAMPAAPVAPRTTVRSTRQQDSGSASN